MTIALGNDISIQRNPFRKGMRDANQALPNAGVLLLRWPAQTSNSTKGWNDIAKLGQDFFEWVSEVAKNRNAAWVCGWIAPFQGVCSVARSGTLIPFFLGATDRLVFKSERTWLGTAKKTSVFVLSALLLGRVTFGVAALGTPLMCAVLFVYTLGLINAVITWRRLQALQPTTVPSGITQDELTIAIDQERKLQMVRVADAVLSVAGEVFALMYPAYALTNATVAVIGSVVSLALPCYRDISLEWHLKIS